jgi:hypothetical protein
MQERDVEDSPRRSIGVALSGGGHRATVFGLGALMYLVDAGLNHSVTSVSSVSGGSILNGFLGLLDTPFNKLNAVEFELHASRLARQIAGDPSRWERAMLLSILLGTVATVAVVLLHSALFAAALSVGALLVAAYGAKSGGTLWAWSGTWIYVLLLMATPAAALAYAVVAPGRATYLALAGVAVLLGLVVTLRGAVASVALGSCCRLANDGRRGGRDRLEDLGDAVTHVLCATEMHSGQHFFFLRNLVYSPGIGVGFPGGLPLRSAIQISANVPMAFPFRLIRSSRFQFGIWDKTRIAGGPTPIDTPPAEGRISGVPQWLRLCDGGVFDNLAVSWFLRARERFANLDSYLIFLANSRNHVREVHGQAREDALVGRLRLGKEVLRALWSPHQLVVVNGGKAPVWHSRSSSWIPFLREFLEGVEVSSAMYDNTQSERLRDLQVRFATGNPPGAVVDLTEAGVSPWAADCVGEIEKRLNRFIESTPWPRTVFQDLREMVAVNSTVPTTLRPLGVERTASLLHQGYLQAMVSLHVRIESPLFDFPDRSRFRQVADAHKAGTGGPSA